MKMRHDPTNITPPKAALAVVALAAVLVVAPPTKARHETAKARHETVHAATR